MGAERKSRREEDGRGKIKRIYLSGDQIENGEGMEEEIGGREEGSRSDGDESREKKRAVKEERR